MDLKRHHAQMLRAIEPEWLRRTCAANGGWGLGAGSPARYELARASLSFCGLAS